MKIEIESNFSDASLFFKKVVERQLPYARIKTVNELGFAIRERTQSEMRRVFDRPTPFALRSIVVERASKVDPSAWVGVRKDGGFRRSLAHEFTGGGRDWKKVEGAFLKLGVLPAGYHMVPGRDLPVNRYGNTPVSVLRKLLKQPWRESILKNNRVRFSTGSKQRGKYKGSGYFVVQPGDRSKLSPGIWERTSDHKIHPIMLFVRNVRYRRLVRLEDIAHWVINRVGEMMLKDHLEKAIATDRALVGQIKKIL